MSGLLTNKEINQLKTQFPHWKLVDNTKASNAKLSNGDGDLLAKGAKLSIDYRFKDFISCFAFMTMIALEAEKQDHHPDWIQSYNRLTITVTSHDVGGLTNRDLRLIEAIDGFYKQTGLVK